MLDAVYGSRSSSSAVDPAVFEIQGQTAQDAVVNTQVLRLSFVVAFWPMAYAEVIQRVVGLAQSVPQSRVDH